MQNLIDSHRLILSEAAVVERLRRTPGIKLHARLEHSTLIYEQRGRQAMHTLFMEYIDVAARAQLPILLGTPTWRANRARITESGICPDINIDAVNFMRELAEPQSTRGLTIRIGGVIGCKNDCYQPREALSREEAEAFHSWQLAQLSDAGVDYLLAVTLPSVEEALGIANAMSHYQKPYILSFVIGKNGCVLDGTPLSVAMAFIDRHATTSPLGYFVNCSYPSFIRPYTLDQESLKRLLGIQANASALDHCELDGCSDLKAESVEDWGDLMLALNQQYGLKILGGCCGTDTRHLDYLVDTHGNQGL